MEEQELSRKERKDLKRQEKFTHQQQQKQQKTFRRILLWSVVVVLLGIGVWGVIALVPEAPEIEEGSQIPAITDQDHFKGSAEAFVVLVEYGDFQCPACASYFSIVQQLAEEFSDEVKIVYRNFPLRSIHPQAQIAAQAAEAAALQGKFWEMHDLLFETQREWSGALGMKERLLSYAESVGLDTELFEKDLNSSGIKDKIQTDVAGGQVGGVPGTPTFFLQGQRIVNPRNYEEFQALILRALEQGA